MRVKNTFYKKYIKRIFDVLLSVISLIILSPIFLITIIAVKLSSPGPAFYYSDRAAKGGRSFHFYKFRSMHVTDSDKGLFIADSERLFTVGKIIRRLKIDEIPQLINVIKGDMSIVGPRPMPHSTVNTIYGGKYKKVLSVRPGLTSAASLYDYTVGDNYTDNRKYIKEVLPVKKEMELLYIQKESFAYDVSLIIRTIITILAVAIHKKKLPKQWEYEIVKQKIRKA